MNTGNASFVPTLVSKLAEQRSKFQFRRAVGTFRQGRRKFGKIQIDIGHE
jgi:hypothetical protein